MGVQNTGLNIQKETSGRILGLGAKARTMHPLYDVKGELVGVLARFIERKRANAKHHGITRRTSLKRDQCSLSVDACQGEHNSRVSLILTLV